MRIERRSMWQFCHLTSVRVSTLFWNLTLAEEATDNLVEKRGGQDASIPS